ncbi:MAG: O-antigen ligase family protein [bacterium]|nr:O-antigen ligase family protein [bacterium]
MGKLISSLNTEGYFDLFILSLIILLISVMGGIGFDFAISDKIVSLHSLRNVLIAVTVIWIIKKLVNKEKSWEKTDLYWPVLFYLLTFILSIFFSSDPKVSLLYFRDFILCIAFYYLIINNIKDKNKLEVILFVLLISVLYTVSRGIFQHIKTQLGISDSNYYSFVGRAEFGGAGVLTMPFFVGFLLNYKKKLVASIFFISGLIVLTVGVAVSYSRGSWIGFLVVVMVFVLLYMHVLKNWRFFTLIFLIFYFVFLILPSTFKERAVSLVNFKDTTGDRIPAWKSSASMIKDFPFFGIGPGTYDIVYEKYKRPEATESYGKGWHAHNIFLHIASENGIIGLVSFLTIIVVPFRKYYKIRNKLEDYKLKNLLDSAYVSLIGYFACSQTTIFFANHNKNEKISMFLWFNIALIFIIGKIANEQKEN